MESWQGQTIPFGKGKGKGKGPERWIESQGISKNWISSNLNPFIHFTLPNTPWTYWTHLPKDMEEEKGNNRDDLKLGYASSITYSTALMISIITSVVSLFITQGAVILTWCTLILTT